MFVVTTVNQGQLFWLRGTVWAFQRERATEYATEQAACEAVVASAKFNPKAAKKAVVVPA